MNNQQEKKLVVLIEDEEIMVSLLSKKLEKAGYLVKSAMDGVSGLELIHDFEPDLVLLDMMLPKLDGFGVLSKLYEEKITPKLPVVIISNSGQPIEIERALNLGIRDYLIKVNFDPTEVLAKVDRILQADAEGATGGEKSNAAGDEKNSQTSNVLIIEDDQFLVELLERKLSQQNCRAFRAVDAEQARRVLSSNRIDLILLDIVLPGKDGFTFLSDLKASPSSKHIPVVIISNLGQKEEMDRGLAAGAADYIIKANSTPGDIVVKIEKFLNLEKIKPTPPLIAGS